VTRSIIEPPRDEQEDPIALHVRPPTAEETIELQRRANARTLPARTVERAKIIWYLHEGARVPAVAQRLGLCAKMVRTWLQRFNASGLAGLEDRARPGRPATYSSDEVGQVLAAALTKPDALGLPFACWTLDRLTTYLHERAPEAGGPLPISRAQIDRLLKGEGLRWRSEATWFGERVDPQFAEKRGSSTGSARPLQPVA
jgi:transposase